MSEKQHCGWLVKKMWQGIAPTTPYVAPAVPMRKVWHAASPATAAASPAGTRSTRWPKAGQPGVIPRRVRQRRGVVASWCRGFRQLVGSRSWPVADRVDEAVRQGGGGRFDRQRPAGSDASQLGAVDASLVRRGDLPGEGRPLRIGSETWMDRLGEPSRRRFAVV